MGQCCLKETEGYPHDRNDSTRKEIYLSSQKNYESDCRELPCDLSKHYQLKSVKSVSKREQSSPFFINPNSNIDDPRIQIIINGLELGSNMNLNLPTDKGDHATPINEISSLLIRVLNSLKGEKEQNPEDNTNLIEHLLQSSEVEGMDPLDFILYLLRLMNNDEDLNVDELPNYYMENTKYIPEEVLNDKGEELKKIAEENGIRKSVGLATAIPYLQICTNPNCSKPLFVNINCELDFFYTYFYKPGVSIADSMNSEFSEIKMKASCVNCKKAIEDYRTRCKKIVVNYPYYLFIKVREEVEDEVYDGAPLKLSEISMLKIQNNSYELKSLITKNKENQFSCFKQVNRVFTDSKQNSVSGDEHFEKAFILLYSLSG